MRYITYMDSEICRLLLAEDGTALTEVAFADKDRRSFVAGRREMCIRDRTLAVSAAPKAVGAAVPRTEMAGFIGEMLFHAVPPIDIILK